MKVRIAQASIYYDNDEYDNDEDDDINCDNILKWSLNLKTTEAATKCYNYCLIERICPAVEILQEAW